jgi:hypothetical protein
LLKDNEPEPHETMPANHDTPTTVSRIGRAFRRVRPAELFDAWLFAEAEATLALAAWKLAPTHLKRDAYATYLAALDREAHAAGVLEGRLAAGTA